MLEHERFDVTQQLPQLFKPYLRVLVYTSKFTLAEHELFDSSERSMFVIGVMNMWGLGEVELGVRFLPVHGRFPVCFDFEKVGLGYLR